MSRRLVCLFGLVVAGLMACAEAPEFQRPATSLPSRWDSEPRAREGARLASQIAWQEFFQDARLRELIARALSHNHDLRTALARVEEARAVYGVSAADRLPTISLNATQAMAASPPAVTGTGQEAKSKRFDLTDSMVSFELDFWGRVASLSEAARSSMLATEASRRSVRLTLISEVANNYFALLETKLSLSLAKSIALNRETALEIVGRGRTLGAASRLEVLQAEAAAEAIRNEVSSLERLHSTLLNTLNYLVGGRGLEGPVGRFLDEQKLDADFMAGIPAEVLLARPDVLASEQRLRAANANVHAARAAFLPKILLTAGLGLASRSLLGLFDAGTRAWNYQPSLSLPVFDGGRAESNLDLAKARENIAVVDYEKTIQVAFREVADLLAARTSYVEQIRIAEATLKIQEERALVVQARHKAGVASYLEVLEAQREQYNAQRSLAQVRRVQLAVLTQLYKALGGGDQE